MAATRLCRVGIALALAGCASFSAFAQEATQPYQALRTAFETPLSEELPGSAVASVDGATTGSYRLSLEEARSRVLQTSVIMDMASTQVAVKCHALQAVRKDYLPKVLNAFTYFHFDSDLGTVLSTPGIILPAQAIEVPVIEQDALLYTATAIQPITPLLKVRELVNVSAAEVRTAQCKWTMPVANCSRESKNFTLAYSRPSEVAQFWNKSWLVLVKWRSKLRRPWHRSRWLRRSRGC